MGGNIFKGYAKPIVRENIRPTLRRYVEHLRHIFPKKAHVFENFYPVGSVGKKQVSGDIDLALDFRHLFDGEPYNLEELSDYKIAHSEWHCLYQKIKSRARTSTDEMCKLKAFLKLIAEPIYSNGAIHVAEDKTTNGNIFTMFPQYDYYGMRESYVQIDWMIGNLPWLKFAYHSGESGNLKGMHRTQLMVAMLSNKGYTFSHLHGIKNKSNNKFVATTPEQAISLFSNLFGKFELEDFHSFLRIHHFLKSYSSKEEYNKIINSYVKILTISKARIPLTLREFENENS